MGPLILDEFAFLQTFLGEEAIKFHCQDINVSENS
jgi:hypothetical protein